ncbi:hypothetical protein IT568_07995 [bacterium]|nr:hypothetical protein [bacterium]
MKNLIFALVFTLCAGNLFGQDSKHTIGMSASSTSGVGLSYKYRIDKDWSVKTNSLIVLNAPGCCDSGEFSFFDVGSELQFNLYRTKWLRLYLLAGGSYWFIENRYEETIYPEDPNAQPISRIDKDIYHNLTIGNFLGIELIAFRHICFNVDFGHFYYAELTNLKSNEFGIGVGIGFGYTFGQ